MLDQAQAFLDRARMSVQEVKDLSGMSAWIERNTADPIHPAKQWSFANHEFQKDILNCDQHKVTISKCSQVGLSEIAIRMALAMLCILPNTRAIYTLPTTSFARRFSKDRIDSVIKQSKYLKPLVPHSTNSSELKLIGNSYLYIAGSYGQNSAISVAATTLIRDEVNFSDQQSLSTFASRLGHASGGGYIRDFSTPTIGAFGISAAYDVSSQARYQVKHDVCGQWVAPTYIEDVVVPGFDNDLKLFDKADLHNPDYKVREAYLNCPHCHNKITELNLADPAKRQWVHAHPDNDHRGFQVAPFDVIKFNPIATTLLNMGNYARTSDFYNFELGSVYSDAETSFMDEMVEKHLVPGQDIGSGCIAGMDVGKTSHILIGKHNDGGGIDVIYAERIRQTGEDYLHTRVMELIKRFSVVKMVVDAAPDFTTAMQLIGANPISRVYGAYYVRKTKTAFSNMDINDDDSIVNIHRTGAFDDLAKEVNSGKARLPKCAETAEIRDHLGNIKRISTTNNDGEQVNTWVKTGEDHFAHALNYLVTAGKLCHHRAVSGVVPSLPNIAKAKLRGPAEENQSKLTV